VVTLPLADRHGLVVLEDCCEALGALWDGVHVGNFGMASAFSFFFSHHLTTMEGGMVTVQDPALADQLRILRAHGWVRNVAQAGPELEGFDVDPRYAFVNWGFNVRPTELQAGFGLAQLARMPEFTARRHELAETFYAFVRQHPFLSAPAVSSRARPVWMALPFLVDEGAPFSRDELARRLEDAGIETRPIVAGNLARQPVARVFPRLVSGAYPGADEVHRRGLYVGLSPYVTDEMMASLIAHLARATSRHAPEQAADAR
jgi:CDP-6-deoxy-D-xylo-4-hexulose-3-dehydrase